MDFRAVLMASAAVAFGLACSPDPSDESCAFAPAYSAEIAPVLATHCLPCHSMGLEGEARRGAPEGVDFDDLAASAPHFPALADAITSGREPPPVLAPELATSREERALLSEWRRCDYPR